MDQIINSLRIDKVIGENPLMINQIIRRAPLALTIGATWEALQAEGWSEAPLAALQGEWEKLDYLGDVSRTLTIERPHMQAIIEEARHSREAMSQGLGGFEVMGAKEVWESFLLNSREGLENAVEAFPKYWGWCWIWSYDDERAYMEKTQLLIDAGKDPKKLKAASEAVKLHWERTRIVGLLETSRSFLESTAPCQTEANLVITAIALERYKLEHHEYPASLSDLTPAYLKSVPVDCEDGNDLRYRRKEEGTFLLYSIGKDGVDDKGDPTPRNNDLPGFTRGRDMVWPRAATPEEMKGNRAGQTNHAAANGNGK